MEQVSDNIWSQKTPLNFYGLQTGTKMTAIKLQNGEVWLHSPIKPRSRLIYELNQLGEVKHIISPNSFHHLFAGHMKAVYPKAKLYGTQALTKKRKDLVYDIVLDEAATYSWENEIEKLQFKGLLAFQEFVFFHTSSKTLLMTDTGFNMQDPLPTFTKAYFKLNGVFGKFSCHRALKALSAFDRKNFNASVDKILQWDFENIVMCHGENVIGNGKQQFARAFK